MADQRIVDYVKSALSTNTSVERIKQDLISRGWSNSEVNEAFDAATGQKLFQEPKKRIPRIFMMLNLLMVIVSAGALGFYLLEKNKTELPIEAAPTFNLVKDCVDNIDCFIDASKSCKASRLKFTSGPINVLAVPKTNTTLYEISGLEAGKCVVYVKAENGNDGICKHNTTNSLTSSLNRWKVGNYSSNDFKMAECSGIIFGQP